MYLPIYFRVASLTLAETIAQVIWKKCFHIITSCIIASVGFVLAVYLKWNEVGIGDEWHQRRVEIDLQIFWLHNCHSMLDLRLISLSVCVAASTTTVICGMIPSLFGHTFHINWAFVREIQRWSGDFPRNWLVMQSFDMLIVVNRNTLLYKQSNCRRFKTAKR